MMRTTPLAALAVALLFVVAVGPAVPDDSALPAEIERLSKEMQKQLELQSVIRQLSTQALKRARSKVLLALKKTTFWGRKDWAVEIVELRIQYELELFRQRMKEELRAILKEPITEDDINHWYADAAARLSRRTDNQ